MRQLTWKLPSTGPRSAGRAETFRVFPDPADGDAWAVCVPLALAQGGWTLKLADASMAIATTPALADSWTEVISQAAGAGATHFACLVGVDQPPDSGGSTWMLETFDHVLPRVLQAAVTRLEKELGRHGLRDRLVAIAAPLAPAALPTGGIAPAGVAMALARSAAVVAAPVARAPSLTLAFASCQYQAGLLDKLPAQASFARLDRLLSTPAVRKPTVLLLLGDQVYVDATAGLLDPVRIDDRYHIPYEELQKIEPLHRITGRPELRIEWMLDDHEITDNWEPSSPGGADPRLARALDAYWRLQRTVPPLPQVWSAYPSAGGWALFMADTRTCRDFRNEASLRSASILGTAQTAALEQWLLAAPAADLKLVAGPAMLLPRVVEYRDDPLHLDNWQGYPASLHGLLAFLCDHQVSNVCFLSGDAHLGCDVDIAVTGPNNRTVTMRSIHTPALYAPLPFANEQPWNLMLPHDGFRFPDPQAGPYTCTVSGRLLPRGDGCCLLEADLTAAGWTVNVGVV